MPAVNPGRARFLDSGALAAGIPWPALLAALVLALGTAAFYSEHLFGDAVIPYDSKDAFYPQSVFVAGEYRSGSIPLWTPYIFSGYPAFADPQHLLYSPAVLLFLIPETLTQQYFDAVAFLHVFATGFLVYLLSREFGLFWLASLIAGL